MVSPKGLPVFSDSARTISSARSSMASAILNMASCRSEGVVSRHVSKALSAAPNARSTSSSLGEGRLGERLARGRVHQVVGPAVGGVQVFAPTKFLSVLVSVIFPPCRSVFRYSTLAQRDAAEDLAHDPVRRERGDVS